MLHRLLPAKPCPFCRGSHGYGSLAVAQSSVVRPLKCLACGEWFHQPGLRVLFLGLFAFPVTLLIALFEVLVKLLVPAAPEVVALAVAIVFGLALSVAVLAVWTHRRYPLVAGPKHG